MSRGSAVAAASQTQSRLYFALQFHWFCKDAWKIYNLLGAYWSLTMLYLKSIFQPQKTFMMVLINWFIILSFDKIIFKPRLHENGVRFVVQWQNFLLFFIWATNRMKDQTRKSKSIFFTDKVMCKCSSALHCLRNLAKNTKVLKDIFYQRNAVETV